jgi:hypothetical protein
MAFCEGCGMAYSFVFMQQFHRPGCRVAEWERKQFKIAMKRDEGKRR